MSKKKALQRLMTYMMINEIGLDNPYFGTSSENEYHLPDIKDPIIVNTPKRKKFGKKRINKLHQKRK